MSKLASATSETDAIEDYLRVRYISAPEAAWRIFGFPISQQSPSIARLAVHMPNHILPRYRTNSTSDSSAASTLLRYFIRPLDPIFDDMLYATYFTNFTLTNSSSSSGSAPQWEENGSLPNAPSFVVRHHVHGDRVARVRSVRPGLGEVFYLRLLLLHHPARSFEQLRSIDGTLYDTFQEAALAASLLEQDDEGHLAMEDAIAEFKSPSQLRFLFVLLIVEGAGAFDLWELFKDDLARDFLGNTLAPLPPLIRAHALDRALENINHLLGEHGKSTTMFGLPAVKVRSAEVAAELNSFNKQAASLNVSADSLIEAMSPDQRAIFDILFHDVFSASRSSSLHFLTGKAG
jgi:hypothetical protein